MVASQNQARQTVVSSYSNTVNALGQRMNLVTSGTAFASSRTTDWGYDILGQVTSAASSDHSADRAYQFDAIGNRLSRSAGVPPASSTATYTANALNQYSAIADPQIATVNRQFDDGNANAYTLPVNPSANATLTWDAENRLAPTTFLYDAQSRRMAKTTGAATTLYLYDGWNVVAEYLGSAGLQPALSSTYLWYTDLSGSMQGTGGVGGLLAVRIQNQQASIYYPTFDSNGNVGEYLTSAGAVAAHFEYDPFGNTTINTDTSGQFTYRFSTKPLDGETGLYYYGFRYFDPATGRWPSRDPSMERAGENIYVFTANDAENRIDVLGCVEGSFWNTVGHLMHPGFFIRPTWPAYYQPEVADDTPYELLGPDYHIPVESLGLKCGDLIDGNKLGLQPSGPSRVCHLECGQSIDINEKVAAFSVALSNTVGHLEVMINGKLTKTCDYGKCGWKFDGTGTALPDKFDFNKGVFKDENGETKFDASMKLYDILQRSFSKPFWFKFDGVLLLPCDGLCPDYH